MPEWPCPLQWHCCPDSIGCAERKFDKATRPSASWCRGRPNNHDLHQCGDKRVLYIAYAYIYTYICAYVWSSFHRFCSWLVMLRICYRCYKGSPPHPTGGKPGIMWRESSQHQVEQPGNRGKEGCRGGSFLTSSDLESGENPGSISIKFVPFLSVPIHFYAFLSISIDSYPCLSIFIHSYPFLIFPSPLIDG